jgi:uncharacterized tellurite resistance protein B-like protein
MFDLIRKALGGGGREEAPAGEEQGVQRTRIAACVLLLEAAHADYECTDEEIAHVLETIRTSFDLPHEYAEELVELARSEREQAVEIWQFASRINRDYTSGEKLEVLETVWRIIYADGRLDKHEDYFVRKLSNLLRLTHREMIEAKLKAIDSAPGHDRARPGTKERF